MEIVVTSAVGYQIRPEDKHGMRIVRVDENGIRHKYFSLEEMEAKKTEF